MDLISVIVPVYQVKKYLRQCVESILNQTYQNLEIILVDDGSTDGSGEICDEYAKKDSRVKVIHKENGGLVSARKAGIKLSSGDFIGYIDSDDYIEKDMYELLYKKLLENNADIVICNHMEEIEYEGITKKIKNYISQGVYSGNRLVTEVYRYMLYVEGISHWGLSPACWDKLYRKDVIYDLQLNVDDRIWDGEDHAFVYQAILNSNCIYITDEAPYWHRIRKNSVATGYDDRAFERFSYLFCGMKQQFKQSKYWNEIKRPFLLNMRWFVYKHICTELEVPIIDEIQHTQACLFPFGKVEKNSKIILYGAGEIGRLFYRQIMHSKFCKIVAWVDKNYQNYKYANYLSSPKDIFSKNDTLKYDYVIVAVEDKELAKLIRNDLLSWGVREELIVWDYPRMEKGVQV